MDFGKFIFDGSRRFTANSVKTSDTHGVKDKESGLKRLEENKKKIQLLQDRLYAERNQGLLVLFQAMDAAGKDGTVNHVFSGINPEGIQVTSYKSPSKTELEHDYLWRIHKEMPPLGSIGVFNRSHYEDVLIAKVLGLPKAQGLSGRVLKNTWQNRYRQINDYERYLYENGYTILKIFLNVSKETQYDRFMARLDVPAKNWKFEKTDLDTRNLWDEYMKAYRECINATATDYAPWAVVPADKKWYMRLLVSEMVLSALKKMNPKYPKLSQNELDDLKLCRERLILEKNNNEN